MRLLRAALLLIPSVCLPQVDSSSEKAAAKAAKTEARPVVRSTKGGATCSQVGTIACGDTVNGSLVLAEDCPLSDGTVFDQYAFNAGAEQRIVADLVSSDFDAFLFLTDADFTVLSTDDDGGVGFNSRISFEFPRAGTAFFLANSFTPAEGDYSLAVVCAAGSDPRVRVVVRIYERPIDYPTTPATLEIDTVELGQDFVVRILVEDIRAAEPPQGVFSGYFDVNFEDAALATLVPSLPGVTHPQTGDPTPYLHNAADFGSFAQPPAGDGLIDTDSNASLDQIDVLGSFAATFSGTGAGEVALVEFAMTAQSPGLLTVSVEPTSEDPAVDPEDAGESPLYDVGLFGQDEPVCPSQSITACMGVIEFVADSIFLGDKLFANGFE